MEFSRIPLLTLAILWIATEYKSTATANSDYRTKNEDKLINFNKLINSIGKLKQSYEDRYNALANYKVLSEFKDSDDRKDPLIAVIELHDDSTEGGDGQIDLNHGIGERLPSRSQYILQSIQRYYDDNDDDDSDDDTDDDDDDEDETAERLLRQYNKYIDRVNDVENEPMPLDEDPIDGEDITVGKTKTILSAKAKPVQDFNETYTKDILRGFKCCGKKALKACKKACKKVLKEICDSYKCSSSLKRRFKKNCKKECKSTFDDDDD